MLLVVVRAHYPNTPLDQNNAWLGRHKGSPQLSKDKLVSVPYGKHSCCCLSGFEMPNSKTLVIKTPRLDIGHTIAVVTPTHGIDNGQPVCNWCCRPPGGRRPVHPPILTSTLVPHRWRYGVRRQHVLRERCAQCFHMSVNLRLGGSVIEPTGLYIPCVCSLGFAILIADVPETSAATPAKMCCPASANGNVIKLFVLLRDLHKCEPNNMAPPDVPVIGCLLCARCAYWRARWVHISVLQCRCVNAGLPPKYLANILIVIPFATEKLDIAEPNSLQTSRISHRSGAKLFVLAVRDIYVVE